MSSTNQAQQQQFKKVFDCMTCGAQIKLSRKPDNSGWNRFNLDGTTEHKCQKKNNQNQQQDQPQQTQTPLEQHLPPSLSDRISNIETRLASIQSLLELLLKQK